MATPSREAIRMTEQEVDAFLRSHWYLVLATHGPRGAPHMATMGYCILDGRVAMSGYERSQKVVNLGRDPRASCLVEEGMDVYAQIRGVQLTGEVEIVAEASVAAEVAVAVFEQRATVLGEPGVAPRDPAELGPKRVAMFMAAERTISWDHRRLDGRY